MEKEFSYALPVELPLHGRTIIYTRDGIITAVEVMLPDQYVSTIPGFIELAQIRGFRITPLQIS